MKKIGVIVNLNSRKFKLGKINPEKTFESIAKDNVIVKYTKTIDEIVDVAKEFKKLGVEYIAPSGGDGTLHHIVTQFSKVYNDKIPPVLILKTGTMNNVATSLEIKGDANDVLHRFITQIKRGHDVKIVTRHTLLIDGRYCFLFGNGLTADFLDVYYSTGKSYRKLVGLILNIIVEAFSHSDSKLFKGFTGNITCDSETLPFKDVLGILAGTVETIGMGFYPLFRANEKDGQFHVIVCAMKPKDLAKQIIKLKKGIPINNTLYYEKTVKEIVLQSQHPFMYTMDGDLYHCDGLLKVSTGIPVQFIVV